MLLDPIIVATGVDDLALCALGFELLGNEMTSEVLQTERFGLRQIVNTVPADDVLTELVVGVVGLAQALHGEGAEFLGLVLYPVKSIFDRYAIELGVEPSVDTRDLDT